ncbi:MAG: hypothetical protein M3Z24_04425 [Chloroflexota bacterium]|nr:hypothetical protein [Chloroflexota bacterium]
MMKRRQRPHGEEVLQRQIEANPLLKEIVMVEPELEQVFMEAALQPPQPDETRWDAYTMLKQRCDSFIGWNARNEKLASSAHYEAFIDFLDALLPLDEEYYRNLRDESCGTLGEPAGEKMRKKRDEKAEKES